MIRRDALLGRYNPALRRSERLPLCWEWLPIDQGVEESGIRTTKTALGRHFEEMATSRVVLEVGPHPPWMSGFLTAAGYEAVVMSCPP